MEFFTQPGSGFKPQFTDETANCLIVSECIFVVLLTEAKFKTFIPKKICDETSSTKVFVCLTFESRQKADARVGKAVAAARTTYNEAHAWIYGTWISGFGWTDLEIIFMEPDSIRTKKLIHKRSR